MTRSHRTGYDPETLLKVTGLILPRDLLSAADGIKPNEMPLRSLAKTIDALRLTLVKLEQTTNTDQGAGHIDHLKRRVIHRIAELEAANALEAAPGEPVAWADTATGPLAAAPPVDTIAGPAESASELKRAS